MFHSSFQVNYPGTTLKTTSTVPKGQDPLSYLSRENERDNEREKKEKEIYKTKIQKIIANKANLEEKNTEGETYLITAINTQNEEAAQLLIKAKANIEALTKYGSSPLLLAASHKNISLVRLLLDAKANPNIQNIFFDTPISLTQKNIDIYKLLLKAQADPELGNKSRKPEEVKQNADSLYQTPPSRKKLGLGY